MLWNIRRAGLVLLIAAGLALVVCLPQTAAQIKLMPARQGVIAQPGVIDGAAAATPAMDTDFADSISLPKDVAKKKQIEAAVDYIKEGKWEIAIDVLQKLIELREDVFVPITRTGADGKETKSWSSVKSEANRLVASLPREGMEAYKLNYGGTAAKMVKDAKEASDIGMLREVMNRFLHTDAGAEATNLLGTYYLDRGTYVSASLCFEKLFNREGVSRLAPVTLFKAAYAFHQAGDKGHEDMAWKELNTRGGQLVMGGERRSLEELQQYVSALERGGADRSQYDWSMFGGSASRNARGEGGTPFMDEAWKKKTVRQELTEQWITRAASRLHERRFPVMPASFPITATITNKDGKRVPLVIYRSSWGIHAVNVKTGNLAWESGSGWSMDMMVQKNDRTQAISNWVDYYLQNRPVTLFENTAVGTLSTDNTYAYVVDDLAVAPPNQGGLEFDPRFNQGNYVRYSPAVQDAISCNRLQAFDLVTGKLKWELGGRGEKVGELADTYFLGPPVPIAGRLYVLTEKQQELRLVCIDPSNGKVTASQALATTKDKLQQDIVRRMQAAHLAYGEGMLVCPTNAGAILGVDLLSNSLVWAHPYREKPTTSSAPEVNLMQPGRFRRGMPPGMMMLPDGRWVPIPTPNSNWQVSAPIIQDGKVVFTAPDAKSVQCLNLRDGSQVWRHNRNEDDLYLGGVYNGKVLIVGKRNIRAISLTKGEPVWSLEVGLPSGQGIAGENIYYLPLKEAAATKKPEICAIDIDRGVVFAHTKSRKEIVPGNLLFYEGDVLSQTATEVMAFPQLRVKLAQIDEMIAKNPNDPIGLTERGELRLDKGDLQGAIDDLSRALKNKPPKDILAKTRVKLYETLTELFQRDFNAAEKYLKEYEELCSVDLEGATTETEKQDRQTESRRRRANFLCLVAKGKEAQGKLIEAFERYMEFSALAGKDELISVIDEPSVRAAPDVWSQGRIKAMADAAKPENRKPLEDRIVARWEEVKKASDIEELRKFVNVFGSLFTVGKEARLQLAERLMDESDAMGFLEAERQLSLLRGRNEDPQLAARAVECLARLNTRKGMLKDAAFYYRLLRRDYGAVKVIDGKTGAEIYDEQATDKRLLPFMDEPQRLGATGQIPVTTERGTFPLQNQMYQLGQVGENLPFFQENQLVVQYQPHMLRMLERTWHDDKPRELWNKPLTQTHFQNLVYGNGQPNMAKFCFQNLGHLVVLPLGHMVFGIDPINGKVLWELNLHTPQNLVPGQEPSSIPPDHLQPPIFDPRDGSVVVTYKDGWVQRLGQTGPLEGNVLCLQTRDALVGIDPLTKRTLWARSDVNTRNQIFGDDQIIYVVEMNNEGKATATRALRSYDGVSVKIQDFAALYEKRAQMYGRSILVSESNEKGQVVLRLYDVLTGQDLMKETFPAGSVQLKSEDPHLSGMVDPDGNIKIVDLKNKKVVVDTKANPGYYKADAKNFTGAVSLNLLSDRQDYYVTVNGPIDPAVMQFGPAMSNLMPGTGMRALPVNGYVFCFQGQTGKMRWRQLVANQLMVLEHFDELPMMLFTARVQKWFNNGVGRQLQQENTFVSIQKSNGKLIGPRVGTVSIPNGMNFHALNVDARAGKVEFVGYQMKLTFNLNGSGATP